MASKLSLKLNNSNFLDFVSKMGDLTAIEDVVKIKIDKDNILMYSMLSNDVSVLALKSYLLKTSNYFDNFLASLSIEPLNLPTLMYSEKYLP